MEQDAVAAFVSKFDVSLVLKPVSIVIIGFLLIFSLVVLRQVGLMVGFLGTARTGLIRFVSWTLLVACFVVLVLILFL